MSNSPLAGKRALVIENNAIMGMMVRSVLRRAGAHASLYGPCEDAAPVLQREPPDLLLVAIMPGNTSEVIALVGRATALTQLCVLAMIDFPDTGIERQLREAGAAAILIKPILAVDLLRWVEETYRKHCGDK